MKAPQLLWKIPGLPLLYSKSLLNSYHLKHNLPINWTSLSSADLTEGATEMPRSDIPGCPSTQIHTYPHCGKRRASP